MKQAQTERETGMHTSTLNDAIQTLKSLMINHVYSSQVLKQRARSECYSNSEVVHIGSSEVSLLTALYSNIRMLRRNKYPTQYTV